MSTLSSASTDAEVEAAYDDNAPYREDNSVSMARAFGTACVIMARRRELEIWSGSNRLRGESLRDEGKEALAWADANDSSRQPRLTKADFTRGRE
jgi:hypothetical protein